MLKRYCDRCNSEMSESVLTHEGISQGVFVSISIDGDRDYCEDCLEKAIQAAIRTLAGEEQETTQVVGLAPIVLAAPQEKPVRQQKPKARPAADPKPEEPAALPDAPEGSRWMTLAEVVGDSGLNGETVRTRLHSMGCAEQVMPRGRTRLYCVTPEQLAAAVSHTSHPGLKTSEAELTGALPKGSECPAGERDSAKDHVAEFQRKLAALREHESARHLLTINGYLGVPRVGDGEKPLTVDIVAPNGREKTFLIDSIAESEVAI